MSKATLAKLMLYVSFAVTMLISLCFTLEFETMFMLKPNLSQINKNALEVHFVDVGQGDAILVKSGNAHLIIDSGDKTYEKQLLNYINNVFFRDSKVKEFDYAILTHSDSDHSGNMLKVLNTYTVKNFIRPKIYSAGLESVNQDAFYETTLTYAELITKLNQLKTTGHTNVTYAEMNTCFSVGGVNLNILAPVKASYSASNEYSTVLTLEKYGSKFMLTGDATVNNELEIINNHQASALDVDVLKVAHHGSSTSTSLEFLEATSPSLAIISVGQNNSVNHPSPQVINNISTYNLESNTTTKIMQTQNLGNIICYVNPSEGVKTATILNVSDYLFVSWWLIVVLVLAVVGLVLFLPNLLKWLKLGKTSKL